MMSCSYTNVKYSPGFSMAMFPETNTYQAAEAHSKNYTRRLTQRKPYLLWVMDNACYMVKSVYLHSIQLRLALFLWIDGRCNFGRNCGKNSNKFTISKYSNFTTKYRQVLFELDAMVKWFYTICWTDPFTKETYIKGSSCQFKLF